MQQKITYLWYQRNLIIYLLLPFAWFYRLIIFLRRQCYQRGWFKTAKFSVPIIVVGNITVGGTGKTPLVIALANYLKQQGYRPGIVSRGYGGKAKQYPLHVNRRSSPQEAGDEPCLIARHAPCTVVVDPKRIRAVDALVRIYHCNVVISDDGLQHYAMGRKIEIAVVDGNRRFGNGFCLPAGPLREPMARLNQVDFIVTHGQARANEYAMDLQVGHLINLANPSLTQSLSDFKNQRVHAIAGVGNPQRFFQTLRNNGLSLIEHVFPDHYHYHAGDINFKDDMPILMTEKDAVKCANFASGHCWYLEVDAQLSEAFYAKLSAKLSDV